MIGREFPHFYEKHCFTRGAGGDTFVGFFQNCLSSGVREWYRAGEVDRAQKLLDRLEELYPGMKGRLVEDGGIRPNLAVAIDGEVARMGLLEKVGENSEVHFVPAIGGGAFGTGPVMQ